MRTTITLDPDVEVLVKNAMRESDASFKQVLNDALRRGLGAGERPPRARFVQRTYDLGPMRVTASNLNALADELEDRELMAKLSRGR